MSTDIFSPSFPRELFQVRYDQFLGKEKIAGGFLDDIPFCRDGRQMWSDREIDLYFKKVDKPTLVRFFLTKMDNDGKTYIADKMICDNIEHALIRKGMLTIYVGST